MNAHIFPGQGSQFKGMAKDIYDESDLAKKRFHEANEILGFEITKIMFEGSDEELKQTNVTQPAIFLHSVILAEVRNIQVQHVAGHSLGEFSALVANKTLSFAAGLQLVHQRALAMQKACELNPSTMAAVLGLADELVAEICQSISDDVVVAANYNCPGQLVISGSLSGIDRASVLLKEAGAKRVLPLPVGGAFHSPLMEPARQELEVAIRNTAFAAPICPIYQNVSARAELDPETIQQNLITQLTAPVRWTQSIQQMYADGISDYIECGPGKVLQGLVKKIEPEATTASV